MKPTQKSDDDDGVDVRRKDEAVRDIDDLLREADEKASSAETAEESNTAGTEVDTRKLPKTK